MIKSTGIAGLYLFEPRVFEDERGYFFESWNQKIWEESGIHHSWVQDNESFSSYGVLRGLHYQVGPNAQAKLVRVSEGVVLDVAVDIRPESPSYGQYFSEILSAENKRQMLIPRGCAHGFVVLSPNARFCYKCDGYYDKDAEGSIHPFDSELNIDWILKPGDLILSEKDAQAPSFSDHRAFEL